LSWRTGICSKNERRIGKKKKGEYRIKEDVESRTPIFVLMAKEVVNSGTNLGESKRVEKDDG